MTKPNGYVIFEGKSLLDGAPIVVIATGFAGKSRNEKTGDMIQTWIIRADVSPTDAFKSGDDASICGNCPHRPANGGACYVTVFQAPLSVWKAYKRGIYPTASLKELAELTAGRKVRLGSYGDPAAVPVDVWKALTFSASAWTGYTHQWHDGNADALKPYVMASADTMAEGFQARSQGWRTFRVRDLTETPLANNEFICPASAEAGYKTDCASCKACMGNSSKARANPVIIVHGAKARKFALSVNGQALAA